jgi:hypothetical protein
MIGGLLRRALSRRPVEGVYKTPFSRDRSPISPFGGHGTSSTKFDRLTILALTNAGRFLGHLTDASYAA